MLAKSTVFVLGAGASKPFEFPTGAELANQLVDQLHTGRDAFNHIKASFDVSDREIYEFRDAFYYSGKNSVDAFLEHRTEYLRIGKIATASLLMTYEQPHRLFRYDNNWLRYLYNNLNTSFEEFGSNKLAIVTFNYDRTVEHFLFTSLKNTYGKTDDECCEALKNIPIIHLHGRLGHLPWQGEAGMPYGVRIDHTSLRAASDGIKIVHEDISDGRDKDFERAKGLMQSADQILIMGFGYNATNVERLGIGKLKRPALGTSIGLNNQERLAISKICDGRVNFCGGDCLQFLREQMNWS